VALDDFTRDVEDHTESGIGACFGIVDLIEALKNLVLVLFGNAYAKILNAYDDLVRIFSGF